MFSVPVAGLSLAGVLLGFGLGVAAALWSVWLGLRWSQALASCRTEELTPPRFASDASAAGARNSTRTARDAATAAITDMMREWFEGEGENE